MNEKSSAMSSSYKAVFIFAIVMMVLVLIGGALTKSKTSGLGVFFWGYTAWLMYKHRNDDLIALYKIVLGLIGVAFGITLVVTLFTTKDIIGVLGQSLEMVILQFCISFALVFAFYRFFQSQREKMSAHISLEVADEFWISASKEFNNSRVEALWLRLYAENNGDENKAKAAYLRIRALELGRSDQNNSAEKVVSSPELDTSMTLVKIIWLGIIILIVWFAVS